MLNQIGLQVEKANALAEKLNELLANYSVFYLNVRGFHWNIKGDKFFELHLKFEELYNDIQLKIDQIAERILTLGHTPAHSFEAYQRLAIIKSVENQSQAEHCIASILDTFKELLIAQREILLFAQDVRDEGTSDLLTTYLSEQEKLVWMYSAYLAR
jgi:starvation-inducible DNA-binding protein